MADYAYPNTRIRVMKSLFLGNRELEALTRVKNLKDYLVFLKQTPYSEILSEIEEVTIQEIERALSMNLIKTIDKVMNISPKNCISFIDATSKKYQLECIKLILNSKLSNMPKEKDEIMNKFYISEKSTEEFLSRLISLPVEPVDSTVALLCERYSNLKEFIPESPQSLDILIALDRYYFFELQKSVRYLNGRDKKIVSRLISMEIDISNIMIILRSIIYDYEIERFIIPSYDPYLNAFDEYTSSDLVEFIEKISKTVYGHVLEDTMRVYKKTKSLLHFELALRRFLIRESKILMEKNPLQFGFILGFLKLKEMEIENLRKICIGLGENLPANEIRELLILPSS